MAQTTAAAMTTAQVKKAEAELQGAREARNTALCDEISQRIDELKELGFQYQLTAMEAHKKMGRPRKPVAV